MTYLQRINYLDRKIDKAKEKLESIEELYGHNSAFYKKEMEIAEYEHLKSWYNSKILQENKSKNYTLCRILNCKYYLNNNCFIGKTPRDNKCDWSEE